MKSIPTRLIFACFLLLCMGNICQNPIPPPDSNIEPVARLIWPQTWSVEEPAPFDASESSDSDGQIDRISMNFGDGSSEQGSADGHFEHLYPAPGSFELRLTVEDDLGGISEILADVVVVTDLDKPSCGCDEPCFDPAECTSDGCFLSGISDDAPENDFPAPVIPDTLACP
jgi:hypothetical protein